jgi:hypothetical protein
MLAQTSRRELSTFAKHQVPCHRHVEAPVNAAEIGPAGVEPNDAGDSLHTYPPDASEYAACDHRRRRKDEDSQYIPVSNDPSHVILCRTYILERVAPALLGARVAAQGLVRARKATCDTHNAARNGGRCSRGIRGECGERLLRVDIEEGEEVLVVRCFMCRERGEQARVGGAVHHCGAGWG